MSLDVVYVIFTVDGSRESYRSPTHDQRDLYVANKDKREILPVIIPDKENNSTYKTNEEAYLWDGKVINSDFCNGLSINEAQKKIIDYLESKGSGKSKTNFRLRN